MCWWWQFDWSFAHLTAPVVTTTSIILSTNKIENGDILVLAYLDCLGKWLFIEHCNICILCDNLNTEFVALRRSLMSYSTVKSRSSTVSTSLPKSAAALLMTKLFRSASITVSCSTERKRFHLPANSPWSSLRFTFSLPHSLCLNFHSTRTSPLFYSCSFNWLSEISWRKHWGFLEQDVWHSGCQFCCLINKVILLTLSGP